MFLKQPLFAECGIAPGALVGISAAVYVLQVVLQTAVAGESRSALEALVDVDALVCGFDVLVSTEGGGKRLAADFAGEALCGAVDRGGEGRRERCGGGRVALRVALRVH